MKIVLIGYMGSGKSSIGQRLSEVLEYGFVDLDAEIEKREASKISKIFEEKGEIYFRKTEATVLKDILSNNTDEIVATGGGTPCYGRIMDDLLENEEVLAVYLKCSIDTLTERLFPEKEHRPMIAHLDTKELLDDFIRKHLFERAFYYNRANTIIDCNEKDEKEVVEKILFSLI